MRGWRRDAEPSGRSRIEGGEIGLLVRNGWSCQVPARRAVERDEDAVARWIKEV